MADDAQNESNSRVVVRVSKEVQFLLTQVAARMLCTKKDLHDQIWCAGFKEVLGVTPEEVAESTLTSLPRSTAAMDPKRLARTMLSGR